MTDNGSFITVDAEESSLKDLLTAMRERKRPVRIMHRGRAVADLTPLPDKRQLEPVDPKLKADISPDYDPCAGVSEEDWPSHLR